MAVNPDSVPTPNDRALHQVTREGGRLSIEILERVRHGEVLAYEPPGVFEAVREFSLRFIRTLALDAASVEIQDDLAQLHLKLDHEQLKRMVSKAHGRRAELLELPVIIGKSLARDGIADRVLISFNEHLRLIAPAGTGKTLGVPPHRDSWYSLPAEGVNFWIPCTVAPGVALYPRFFAQRLSVGHKDKATKHHVVRDVDFSRETPLVPSLRLGEALLFSGNHLHRSEPNGTPSTRVSWDYRLLAFDAVARGLRLHEFVFVDLLLERPHELAWVNAETQRRLRRKSFALAFTRGMTGWTRPKLPFTRFGRALKNTFPGTFYS